MTKKALHIVIAAVLLVCMAHGSACAARFTQSENSHCGTGHLFDAQIATGATDTGHVMPCRVNPLAFRYLRPEPLFRRPASLYGQNAMGDTLPVSTQDLPMAPDPGSDAGKALLKWASPLISPPLLLWYCRLIR